MNAEPNSGDAHAPAEIARLVESMGVAKAQNDVVTELVLAVLAGAFISLGALFYLVVITGAGLGFGVTRLLGGLAFSLGLILVVVAGAELFTGNNLLAMAWASRRIGTRELLRNWMLSYFGNVVGCLGTVALAMGARSVTDKIMAIIFPITAFTALGFEHSIANWFLLPFGMALDRSGTISVGDVARNLAAVTAGNIIGGSLLVAGVYWLAYLRGARAQAPR